MGFFDRFRSSSSRTRSRAEAARKRELLGDLAGAAELYDRAGEGDEAARVLLLRADAELLVERRIAFCSAAERAAQSDDVKRVARARRAHLALDRLRAQGTTVLRHEMLAVACDLEEIGEHLGAADAYALLGDLEGEVRALSAAGALERLEARLAEGAKVDRGELQTNAALAKAQDLDGVAERRRALAVCRESAREHPDPRFDELVRAIRGRLARGPVVELEIGGTWQVYALGASITIGRGEATLVVASPAMSRIHLRLRRDARGTAVVEDVNTRNGTTLAGARLSGPIPVGPRLELVLGGEVPCALSDGSRGVVVEVAGMRVMAPLAELNVGESRVTHEIDADGESFVGLVTPEAGPCPFRGTYELGRHVELCYGDELLQARNGATLIRVRRPRNAGEAAMAGDRVE